MGFRAEEEVGGCRAPLSSSDHQGLGSSSIPKAFVWSALSEERGDGDPGWLWFRGQSLWAPLLGAGEVLAGLLRDFLWATFTHHFLPGQGLPLPAGSELRERSPAAPSPVQGDLVLEEPPAAAEPCPCCPQHPLPSGASSEPAGSDPRSSHPLQAVHLHPAAAMAQGKLLPAQVKEKIGETFKSPLGPAAAAGGLQPTADPRSGYSTEALQGL